MENNLNHIAIVMDGNGRWARMRGFDRTFGHREGLKKAEEVILWAMDSNIKYITLYVFSTENWKRQEREVKSLFMLAEKYVSKLEKFCENRIKLIISGERDRLPQRLVQKFNKIEEKTRAFDKICVNLLINYGGRQEIVSAVQRLTSRGEEVTEQSLLSAMYNNIPEPDMIVRTGGQMRLSNFLLYQSAYSELYFTDTLWPDFDRVEFNRILEIYFKRVRNFGG